MAASWTHESPLHSRVIVLAPRLAAVLRNAGPSLVFGLRLWAAVVLALYVAFWLQLDNPYWAGASAAIVCQPQLGASLRKGWFRMIGTAVGAAVSVVLVACFGQDRTLFLGAMAVWGAASAFAATLLRNFASYAAALAGFTVVLVAGDLFGNVGGPDANAGFLLAVSRASEICIGIVCAGVVLGATDFGGARRRLAAQFADLMAGITDGVISTLARAGRELPDTELIRCEFVRRVIALDPVIDQTLGESARLRYHSPELQSAVDGLFTALAEWRTIANLPGLRRSETWHEAAVVLANLSPELKRISQPAGLVSDPVALYRCCEPAVRGLIALPATTPSLRLLADKVADAFAGIAQAFNGLALLVADPARPMPRAGIKQVRVPDWLPALVNASRAFITIGAASLFWVVTAWPGGTNFVTFATVVVLTLAPRSEQAYGAALVFIVGAILDLAIAAVVAFAVLPGLGIETFAGFSLVLAVCLVPMGALLAHATKPWQVGLFTGMTLLFVVILQPTNPTTYNPELFYNTGEVLVFAAGLGAMSFRLLPPLSPAFRAHRLLMLTLRDLRRLAMGRYQGQWKGVAFGRLGAMPEQATPPQRAQLLVAFSAGSEIIRLRQVGGHLGLGRKVELALAALAEGHSARTVVLLSRLDAVLAADTAGGPARQAVLRARGSILALSAALVEHAGFFDAEART